MAGEKLDRDSAIRFH